MMTQHRLTSRDQAQARDGQDCLAPMRAHFALPDDITYLDGNSLGPLPHAVRARMTRTVNAEWGQGLIRSWNDAGWIDLPERVGARIARLIGAPAQAVFAADSTSVNLFKLLSAALALRPERRVIVSERGNFPTDLYMAQGLITQLDRGHRLVLVDDASAIPAALCDDTALLMLTHVDYRSGAMHDMAALTHQAHRVGALTLWDLGPQRRGRAAGSAWGAMSISPWAAATNISRADRGAHRPFFRHVARAPCGCFVQPLRAGSP